MTDNVIPVLFTPDQTLDAQRMLESIIASRPEHVFVICWPGTDGDTVSYHSNTGDVQDILFRLNEFIHGVYSGKYSKA